MFITNENSGIGQERQNILYFKTQFEAISLQYPPNEHKGTHLSNESLY